MGKNSIATKSCWKVVSAAMDVARLYLGDGEDVFSISLIKERALDLTVIRDGFCRRS